MNESSDELSARFYAAEAGCWLLAALLTVVVFWGYSPGQSLPFLNFTPANEAQYSRIASGLLVAALIYLRVEWKESPRRARLKSSSRTRILAAFVAGATALALSYPVVAKGTRFAEVPLWWHLGFAAIGYALGMGFSILAFSVAMIRSRLEAQSLHLPRIPAAVMVQFFAWLPGIALLVGFYFFALSKVPVTELEIAHWLVIFPCLALLFDHFRGFWFPRDDEGKRISYQANLKHLKAAHDFHDYAYLQIGVGKRTVEECGINPEQAPRALQAELRTSLARNSQQRYQVAIRDEIQLRLEPTKDGTDALGDRPVRVRIVNQSAPGSGSMRVSVAVEGSDGRSKDFELPVSMVELGAEEYLAVHGSEVQSVLAAFQHGVQGAIANRCEAVLGASLHDVILAGEKDLVEKLVGRKDVDLNAKGGFGWTPLHLATANGSTDIVRILLKAGANPDLGNLLGITPLMFAARYGDLETCALLLEYGAALDQQDVYGATALMVASREGSIEVATRLIEKGANIKMKSREGETALEMAHKWKHGEIAKLLRAVDSKSVATQ